MAGPVSGKSTDKQRILPYSTIYPKQCLKNIPFVMARRICSIVENNSIKNKHLNDLKRNFEICDYLEKIAFFDKKEIQLNLRDIFSILIFNEFNFFI